MNKDIMKACGFGKAVENFEAGKCTDCGKAIDIKTEFVDALSKKEYFISGLCQDCQDSIFHPEE